MANEQVKKSTSVYVLRTGHEYHGFKDGARHKYVGGEKGNDRVELTDGQAKAFADKFDSLKVLQARSQEHEEKPEDLNPPAKRPDPSQEELGQQNADAANKNPASEPLKPNPTTEGKK